MKVLAIDPGKETGWAVYDTELGSFEAGETDFDETCRLLLNYVTLVGRDLTIVAEKFLITTQTPKNSQAPWSLELIGVCRLMSRMWTGKELVLQTPAQAKGFSNNARLHHLGFWTPGRNGHANDAARHLLLFIANRGLLPKEKLAELVDIV